MKAFRYRLSALLTRAEHRERVLQMELATLQEALEHARQQLESLRALQAELHSRVRDLLKGDGGSCQGMQGQRASSRPTESGRKQAPALPLRQLDAVNQDLDGLGELILRCRLLYSEFERRVAATRDRLVEASRERRMLENHRADLARRHRRSELAAETKHLDELGSAGAARCVRVTPEGGRYQTNIGGSRPDEMTEGGDLRP